MLSPPVEQAASIGILARLPVEKRRLLLGAGHSQQVDAGTLLYVAEDRPPFVALLIEGFLRVFVAAPSGRESTIRYVRPGDLLGVVAVLSGPSNTWVQSLAQSTAWMVDPQTFTRIARADREIAWVLAEECAARTAALVNEIAGSAFATVRQRIAHHLMAMARSQPEPPYLLAPITQNELANAAGSVREVTVRELRALKDEGLVTPRRGGIALNDPDRLERIAAEAFQSASGT